MKSQWYLADRNTGQTLGPFTAPQLKRMVSDQQLLPTDMLLCEANQKWIKAGSIKNLFSQTIGENVLQEAPATVPEALVIPHGSPSPKRVFPLGFVGGISLGILFGAVGMYLVTALHHDPDHPTADASREINHESPPPMHPAVISTSAPPARPAPSNVDAGHNDPPVPAVAVEPSRVPPPPPPENAAPKPPPAPANPAGDWQKGVPPDQIALIEQVDLFAKRFADAPNDLAKHTLFDDRDVAIQKAMPNRTVKNWPGTFDSVSVINTNNDVMIKVRLAGPRAIFAGAWWQSGNKVVEATLIRHGTQVQKQVAELRKGDRVLFSGEFIPGLVNNRKYHLDDITTVDYLDYLGRPRIDYGNAPAKMNNPEFLFRFDELTRQR